MNDIAGQRFGHLVALSVHHKTAHNERYWKCLCDCGNETVKRQSKLTAGKVKSCGCLPLNKYNLSGQRFGKLVAREYIPGNRIIKGRWNCLCDCGSYIQVETHALVSGRVTSCGCVPKVHFRYNPLKHMYKRLYTIWGAMKSRCYYERNKNYNSYGGRGISICEEWRSSFNAFATWALSNGYSDTLTIDRIDVNGDYVPENCRWITMLEQQRNKRKRPSLVEEARDAHAPDGGNIGSGSMGNDSTDNIARDGGSVNI